jgi:hypothetical protein
MDEDENPGVMGPVVMGIVTLNGTVALSASTSTASSFGERP